MKNLTRLKALFQRKPKRLPTFDDMFYERNGARVIVTSEKDPDRLPALNAAIRNEVGHPKPVWIIFDKHGRLSIRFDAPVPFTKRVIVLAQIDKAIKNTLPT